MYSEGYNIPSTSPAAPPPPSSYASALLRSIKQTHTHTHRSVYRLS